MTDKKQTLIDSRDGFDLIDYPCDYMFKAMCRVTEGQNLSDELSQLVANNLNQQAILGVKTASSRTGKFESVSITVRLKNRDQLESVYQSIVSSPFVVMTL